jgi:nickel transport protein
MTVLLLLGFLLVLVPAPAPAQDGGGQAGCPEVMALLEEQNTRLAGDLRRIHREIAALRADMEKPGFREAVAGIGYIAGLFGVAAFVASRRRG